MYIMSVYKIFVINFKVFFKKRRFLFDIVLFLIFLDDFGILYFLFWIFCCCFYRLINKYICVYD